MSFRIGSSWCARTCVLLTPAVYVGSSTLPPVRASSAITPSRAARSAPLWPSRRRARRPPACAARTWTRTAAARRTGAPRPRISAIAPPAAGPCSKSRACSSPLQRLSSATRTPCRHDCRRCNLRLPHRQHVLLRFSGIAGQAEAVLRRIAIHAIKHSIDANVLQRCADLRLDAEAQHAQRNPRRRGELAKAALQCRNTVGAANSGCRTTQRPPPAPSAPHACARFSTGARCSASRQSRTPPASTLHNGPPRLLTAPSGTSLGQATASPPCRARFSALMVILCARTRVPNFPSRDPSPLLARSIGPFPISLIGRTASAFRSRIRCTLKEQSLMYTSVSLCSHSSCLDSL